jgi:diguanylate cyclase (GGDEF)-like protein
MYFRDIIDLKIQDALIKAKRQEVIEAIIRSQANDEFNALMQELKKYGYLQVNLLKADGTTLFSVGHAAPPLQSVKISQKDDVFLEWANGYRLKIKTSVIDRDMKIGYIESIIELNQLSEFQKTVINKPGTADMVICGLENKYLKCFPFRWNEKPDSYYGFPNGTALPVTKGALGDFETSIMTDYRKERVMASIGPIGNTGLGMALKVDMSELYEPIKKQFYASFPLLIMFILGSIGLLRFKLKPLLEELEKSRLQMKQLAFHDTLTLLANKGLFHDHLLQAIARLSRNHKQLALLYLDIDFFKRVNDTYGHIVGDKLLIWFADVLRSSVRESDTVARIGGDEFAIILENPRSQQKVEQIAGKIIAKARQELDIFPDGAIKSITTSIGIAITGKSDVSPEKLMQYADAALYKSKHNGRNTYSISNLDEVI